MEIVLKPKEKISVTFDGTDGKITVEFNKDGIVVKEEDDIPDNLGRHDIIYNSRFVVPF